MSTTFTVVFKDYNQVVVNEFLDLNKVQIDQIHSIAANYEKDRLRTKHEGFDLEGITSEQIEYILNYKDMKLGAFEPEEIRKQNLVRFFKHSFDNFDKTKSPSENVLLMIECLKVFNEVHKVQWKGYEQLTYTLQDENNVRKISYALIPTNQEEREFSIVTVINFNGIHKSLNNRLSEVPQLANAFEELKKRLNKK